MELELLRTYFSKGTNGILLLNKEILCYTIELPWQQNMHGVSCIPEGKYELRKCYNQRFGDHFIVMQVKDRDGILIHPANDAMKELKGCIAPVSKLTGEGQGIESRNALKKMVDSLQHVGSIFLTIKTNIYDINRKNTGTDAEYIQEDKKYWNCVGIS